MTKTYMDRLLRVPERSFFLFGPRGTGKSTWLRRQMADAYILDLLDSALFLELTRAPERLEALIGQRPAGSWIVLDEIQKTPHLLDEVHRLIESRGWRFALCGSSARKLRRSGVNLLAGRAITLHMESFVAAELKEKFNLQSAIEWGSLPFVVDDHHQSPDILAAYVNTYLQQEIREEGLIRKVPPFLRFLGIAGQLNGQTVNGQNIAREAAVPRSSVDVYFSILNDTLLGHFLPVWRPRLKIRETSHPKFYWFDSGVARAAAGWLRDPVDRLWKGFALETLLFHELRVYNETSGKHRPISYYRTASGVEIDFIIETRKASGNEPPHIICIEVKLAPKWDRGWERAMRDLRSQSGVRADRLFGIYTGTQKYHFDGLNVWPVEDFLKALHSGEVF